MLNKLFKAHKDNREDGFTLIELLIVIVIIGILAAIAVPVFNNQQDASRNATVKSDVRNSITPVQTALISNPNALGFTVLAPGDTVAAISVLKASAIPVPTGYVAVHLTKSGGNDTVITNPDGTGSGSGSGYLIHGQNAKTGFWVEFNSTTGQFTSSAKTNAIPVVATSRVLPGATSASVTPFTHAATTATVSALNFTGCDVNPTVVGVTQMTSLPTQLQNTPNAGGDVNHVLTNASAIDGGSIPNHMGFSSFKYSWPSTPGTLQPGEFVTVVGTTTPATQQALDWGNDSFGMYLTGATSLNQPNIWKSFAYSSFVDGIPGCGKLTVTKTAQIGASGSTGTVKAGDVITYSYNAKNDGNLTQKNISIGSYLAGVSTPAISSGNLAPGASFTGSSSYTITAADIAAGKVVDTSNFSSSGLFQPPNYYERGGALKPNVESGSIPMTVLLK